MQFSSIQLNIQLSCLSSMTMCISLLLVNKARLPFSNVLKCKKYQCMDTQCTLGEKCPSITLQLHELHPCSWLLPRTNMSIFCTNILYTLQEQFSPTQHAAKRDGTQHSPNLDQVPIYIHSVHCINKLKQLLPNIQMRRRYTMYSVVK